MWAKRYNDENNMRKSIAHLDRAMAYGASSPPYNTVYMRAESARSAHPALPALPALFYHVTETSIDLYHTKHLDYIRYFYVQSGQKPNPDLRLTIRPWTGRVEWPHTGYEFNLRANEIKADVRSICKTKLRWRDVSLINWPFVDYNIDEDDYKGEWRTYDSVVSCVDDLYSKWEAEQERKRNRQKGMCFVCLNKPTEVACMPCGHKCFCKEDAPSVIEEQTCPACAMPITSLMRIFES